MRTRLLITWALLVACSGCDEQGQEAVDPFASYKEIQFNDNARTNTELDATAHDVTFQDLDGNEVTLEKFRGQKNVLLVITRGSRTYYICPRCTAQTSRLIRNAAEFEKRNTEILVVYPGPTQQLEKFKKLSLDVAGKESIPFSILLDKELDAIKQLSLEADLAKPATFIIDKRGNLRFAYVGTTVSDRPSLKSILEQLDLIQSESQGEEHPADKAKDSEAESELRKGDGADASSPTPEKNQSQEPNES